MWFGDLITCRTWEHIWLNEGFATYFTDLFFEHFHGTEEFLARRVEQNRDYMEGTPKPEELKIEPRPRGDVPLELGGGKAYSRGAAVLHMLRREIGDEAFREGLREYVRRNRDQPVVSEQLRRSFEDVAGRDLEWFFRQWVYGVGYPRLSVRLDAAEGVLVVRQVQPREGAQGLFRLSVPVCVGPDGPVRTLHVHREEHRFPLSVEDAVGDQVAFVRFGVGGDLLAQVDLEQPRLGWYRALAEDPDFTGRWEAVRAIEAEGSAAVAALGGALDRDASFAVRREAARALGRLEGPGAVEALLRGSQDPDARVREAVMEALGAKDRASAGAAVLRAAAEDPHPHVRAAAATAIGRLKAEGAFEALAGLLEGDSVNDRLRCGALDGLRHLGDLRGAALAERFLPYECGKGANHVVRETALRARCALGAEDRRLIDVVLPLLDDPYHRMRAWAAEMAGTYGLEAATGRLEKMAAEDWDGGAKGAAKTALERLEKARAAK